MDAFTASMVQYRNTPCRFIGVSPSQILFPRKLWDQVCVAPEQLLLRAEWDLIQEEGAGTQQVPCCRDGFCSRATRVHEELRLGATSLTSEFQS